MAKIRKRGNSYQIDYFDPDGKRVRQSFRKRKDAEAELGKRVSLIAEGRYLDVKKDYKTTLKDLLAKYKENYQNQSSYHTMKKFSLENIKAYFGEDTKLANIRYVDLETYRNHLRQKATKHKTIRAVASINREIACLRHLFTKAVEWDMMERNPFDKGKSPLGKENNKRFRYLTEDEITALIGNCVNDYTKDVITATINTGMRKQEVLGHKSLTMTMRYAHLSQEHKKKAVNLLNGLTAPQNGDCHKTVTSPNVTETATS
jgi:site-specific recombinase XerD